MLRTFNTAAVNILHNGTKLSDRVLSSIEEVHVEDEINVPAMFSLKLSPADIGKGSWKFIEIDEFQPGDTIDISIGHEKAEPVISGEITAIEAEFSPSGHVFLRGFDRLHRLRFGKKRRTFQDIRDSDLASQFGKAAGLSVSSTDTNPVYGFLFQNNQSDYDFLLERAQRIGYEISVTGKTLFFMPTGDTAAATLGLEYGLDLERITVALRTPHIGSEVEVVGWNARMKAIVKSTSTKGRERVKAAGKLSGFDYGVKSFGSSATLIDAGNPADEVEARAKSDAAYNDFLQRFVSAEGTCIGSPQLRSGRNIELKGLGKKFTGTYYVRSSKHVYTVKAGYMTRFKAARSIV